MLTFSQILLIIFSLLVGLLAEFMYFYLSKSKLSIKRKIAIVKVFAWILFLLCISGAVIYFTYFLKFILYYGSNAVALIFVILLMISVALISAVQIRKNLSIERVRKFINV